MRTLRFRSRTFQHDLAAFCRTATVAKEVSTTVAAILADVRVRGDRAIIRYTRKFNGAKLKEEDFRISAAALNRAAASLDATQRKAILAARKSVADYNRRNLPQSWRALNPHGAEVGERFYPLRRVGINVPGGQVPLVSTAIMTVLLAKLAGVPEIVVFTPCNAAGRVADDLLAVLQLCGATEVYRIGGVQGVGAMAYGTATIPAVDKIFGPSNAYVCEAMRQVFGAAGVAGLPGPSELMVIADETSRADFAAADLLAQAEHGSGKEKIYLVATSPKIIAEIAGQMEAQLKTLARGDLTRRVVKDGFLAIETKTLAEAATVANFVAPEHLELLVAARQVPSLLNSITTAGAIMAGNYTPTALGDFVAGPSHVLPTGRTGRFFSGLRVADFMRRTSVVRYDRRSVRKAAPTVTAFAAMEQLGAHGRSVEIRCE